jgi:hydrogenase nickel incorporation protein HypA/HybF
MHEFSLATDLLKLARHEASRNGISIIKKLTLRVGDISGVHINAVEFAYSFLKEESDMTKSAVMEIEHVEGRGKCRNCGADVKLERYFLFCPECGQPSVEIISGREFMLVSLEGEEAEEKV